MPVINDIVTAVWRSLAANEAVAGLCTVYKGGRRPAGAHNPTATVDIRRLERGAGEGIWMCDVVVNLYADLAAARMPDHETLRQLADAVRTALVDAEVDLAGGKALPLIEGESSSPDWQAAHDGETAEELVFGLVFITFD